jgi:hypothetical protein
MIIGVKTIGVEGFFVKVTIIKEDCKWYKKPKTRIRASAKILGTPLKYL